MHVQRDNYRRCLRKFEAELATNMDTHEISDSEEAALRGHTRLFNRQCQLGLPDAAALNIPTLSGPLRASMSRASSGFAISRPRPARIWPAILTEQNGPQGTVFDDKLNPLKQEPPMPDSTTSMPVVVGPSRHVGLRFTSLALHMSQASEYSCWRFCGRCSPRTARK